MAARGWRRVAQREAEVRRDAHPHGTRWISGFGARDGLPESSTFAERPGVTNPHASRTPVQRHAHAPLGPRSYIPPHARMPTRRYRCSHPRYAAVPPSFAIVTATY